MFADVPDPIRVTLSVYIIILLIKKSFLCISLSRRLRWGCKGNHFFIPTKSFLKIYSIYFSDIEILILKYQLSYLTTKLERTTHDFFADCKDTIFRDFNKN